MASKVEAAPMTPGEHVAALVPEVQEERLRQVAAWPNEEHLPGGTGGAGRGTYMEIAKLSCDRAQREGRLTHAHIFEEEAAEVLAEEDPAKLRVELVQVMAVCAKWIYDLDGGRGRATAGDRVRVLAEGLCEQFESAVRHFENHGKGGQQVPFHGDFASVGPSVVSRMRWWARELREAFAEGED